MRKSLATDVPAFLRERLSSHLPKLMKVISNASSFQSGMLPRTKSSGTTVRTAL